MENNPQNGKLIESGLTEILNQKSYFLHTKSNTNTYGEAETISFILDSGTEGVFYNLIRQEKSIGKFFKHKTRRWVSNLLIF